MPHQDILPHAVNGQNKSSRPTKKAIHAAWLEERRRISGDRFLQDNCLDFCARPHGYGYCFFVYNGHATPIGEPFALLLAPLLANRTATEQELFQQICPPGFERYLENGIIQKWMQNLNRFLQKQFGKRGLIFHDKKNGEYVWRGERVELVHYLTRDAALKTRRQNAIGGMLNGGGDIQASRPGSRRAMNGASTRKAAP
jgi:hypothetical protein